jgi:predicted DNA-binding protein (MmcQ/YjbR family)
MARMPGGSRFAAARRPPRDLSEATGTALVRLRRACAGWAGVAEVRSFGHPAFRVGKDLFAVLDRYRGHDCLWLKVPPDERAVLLATPGWFAAPYDPRRVALCVRLDAIDWRRIRAHLRVSYALAAARPARARATAAR